MGKERVGELVHTEVLKALVCIVIVHPGSMDKCKAKLRVVGFVPAVFAVIEHRHAICPVGGADISPLVSLHLILPLTAVAALDGTKGNVVGGLIVTKHEVEGCLEHGGTCLPINFILEVHTVVKSIHADILHETRPLLLPLHAEGAAQWARLRGRDTDHIIHRSVRLGGHVRVFYLPRRPCRGIVVKHLLRAIGHKLTSVTGSHQRLHITRRLVQGHAVSTIAQRQCAGVLEETARQ